MINKLILIFFVILIAFIFNIFGIRFCPIFNLFNIPCVGCGFTRAVLLIFEGNIIESFKYNILPLPILIAVLTYLILYTINKENLKNVVNNNKGKIIITSVFIMIIVWIINVNNDLLY